MECSRRDGPAVSLRRRARRRGLGRQIVDAAVERLAALGCPKVNLQVVGSNRDVVAFYERLGFVVEDRVSLGKALGDR